MGRFFLGLAIGAAVGAAAAWISTPRAGGSARQQLGERISAALDVARQTSTQRSEVMWNDFRQRQQLAMTPPPPRRSNG